MLVKLRISNEQEWIESNSFNQVSINEQYLELFKTLIESLEEDKIPTCLIVEYKDFGDNLFDFNGYDSKTNTYFFIYNGTAS